MATLDEIIGDTPYGKVVVTHSRSNGKTTAVKIERHYPERFDHDNARAQGYINTLVRGYMAGKVNGLVTLELLFKDGDLMLVTEHRTAG